MHKKNRIQHSQDNVAISQELGHCILQVCTTKCLVLLLVKVQQHMSSILLYSHRVSLLGSQNETPQIGPYFHVELANARAGGGLQNRGGIQIEGELQNGNSKESIRS